MNLTSLLLSALVGIVSLLGAAVGGYEYGLDVQQARSKAALISGYDDAIAEMKRARESASEAWLTQVNKAEQYAKDLGEARSNIEVITKEIPTYVAANPAPRSCDISDWLFVAFNKAAAETREPGIRVDQLRSGGGDSR